MDTSKFKDPAFWNAMSSQLGNMAWAGVRPVGDIGAPMAQYQQGLVAKQEADAQKALAAQQQNQTQAWLEQNNPELAQAVKIGAMDYKTAFNEAYKQRTAAKAPKKYDIQKGPNDALIAIDPYNPTDSKTVVEGQPKKDDQFKTQLETMRTYRSEDVVKTYVASRDNYEKLRSAASLNTPQGDIALVFSFMKMLDPSSTVNTGEYANASNAGSISDTVRNMYNKVLTGERLSPEQRVQFVKAAEEQYKNTEINLRGVNERYTGLADEYGVPTDRFLEKPKTYEPLQIGAPAITMPTNNGDPVLIQRTK